MDGGHGAIIGFVVFCFAYGLFGNLFLSLGVSIVIGAIIPALYNLFRPKFSQLLSKVVDR